jgi:hypothetical protein
MAESAHAAFVCGADDDDYQNLLANREAEKSCQEIATIETTTGIITAEARARETRAAVKTAPVTERSVEVIAAKAARSTEISATTTLTARDAAARPAVAAVDATTDAKITGAGAAIVTAQTSDALAVTRAVARDAAAVAVSMSATTMGAHGLRKRVTTRAAGLKSVGAVPRARTCVAAT